MTRRLIPALLVIVLLSLAVAMLVRRPLRPVEEQVTALKYAARGPVQPDTNIVIVYIDNDAVRDLGWPVRRNFYALMIQKLTELRVKAIGIEVMFEDANPAYPEYDGLLASTIAQSGRVVLPVYCDSILDGNSGPVNDTHPFVRVEEGVRSGKGIHTPLHDFTQSAAGIGHTNFGDGIDMPLFVRSESGIVPSFAMEMLRVFEGVPPQQIVASGGWVSIGGAPRFAVDRDRPLALNFPGPIRAYSSYPFVEVLKAYDALRKDRSSSIPVSSFAGKIVLVGIVGAGRSVYVHTPVADRYPSIGLHATFLDNALHDRFLHEPGYVLSLLLMSLTALACGVPVLVFRSPLARLLPVGILLVVAGLSFLLFAGVMWNIPLVPLLVAGSIAGASGYVYRQSVMAKNMGVLQHERDRIAASLREKEKKVLQLEDELLRNGSDRQNDRTAELLEEIRKYKAEVHTLAARADDLEVFTTTESDSSSSPANFEGILHSPAGAMKSVVEFVGKIAKSSAPVLILGESGTGKELVARAIHNRSTRAGKAFVAINCGALSESLLESELFGHDKGAFTGAVKDRLGRFELADGGTLFLDEIGEVSESFQVKLLRVLQQGEFEHVGGSRTLKVDTRVVAATNKDLRTLVEQKGFREDLFYRLNVLTVSLPALRDRQEDIPLLAHHFLRREENSMQMSRVVMDALQAHPWRGNVRELESAMMRAVLLAKSDGRTMVSLKDLPEGIAASVSGKTAIDERIMDMLREKGFSRSAVSETAEELGGLNRGTVAEYLRGQSLKIFCEQQFNPEASASHISLSTNPDILGRVDKRLREYLLNISTVVHSDLPWDDVRAALRSKTKNLPQRYHVYVEEIARAFHDGTLQPDPHS